ncbi:MAG TPA: adenylate/guanylate cyclase domain-containing protein [Candidatus Limnocylindrales bacterium]|nr:adenylate/guanylate cyclase domain-containing protein [Candidatus Limnocylindrales bacterium]
MAQLGAKARAKLPDSAFAYIDPTGRRLLPINDEAHVRNALARFNRVAFDDEASRDKARTRLLKAAKRYGLMPVGFIDGELRPERRLPTGRVALMLADVEDSTGHLTELGDRYERLLADVRRLLRTATRRAGGQEVDARGDEFFAAFPEPSQALKAAVAVQRAFGSHAWTDGRSVRVRIGLHLGRPTLTATGYVGIAVNTVARLSTMGHGSQILASWSLRDAAGDADGIGWRAMGRHRLRGIPDEHELFQVEANDLGTDFPPLREPR